MELGPVSFTQSSRTSSLFGYRLIEKFGTVQHPFTDCIRNFAGGIWSDVELERLQFFCGANLLQDPPSGLRKSLLQTYPLLHSTKRCAGMLLKGGNYCNNIIVPPAVG